ncbi:MAG: DNA-binding protein [Methylobacter sp.]
MASLRLTESEVHAACFEIAAQGERPTALTLLDKLGRGSLTTISKYLNSWNTTDEAKVLGAESLPAVVKLPPELTKDGEDLIKKIWAIAKGIADEELDIQRDALKQAELANQSKVEEAFKFSEAQSMKIDRLEDTLTELQEKLTEEQNNHAQAVVHLNEAEKANVGLSKDNDRLQYELGELKKLVATLEEANKAAAQEKQKLQQNHDDLVKQKEAEIKSLDKELYKLQSSLEAIVKTNDQLNSELNRKTADLSDRAVELDRLNVRFESAASELENAKYELKTANKAALDAEKLVSNLEGQLKVYKSLEKDNSIEGEEVVSE